MNYEPISRRINFLDCPIDLISTQELLAEIEQALLSDARIRLEGLNVAKLIDSRHEPELKQALEQAERVHVDGAGISLGLKWLQQSVPPRRAGIDLLGDLCALAARLDAPVYLLGAQQQVVESTAEKLIARYPGLRIAGIRDGYFSPDEEPAVVEAIRASGAKLLFIGISSPKKELFLRKHWEQLAVNLGMGVGGSFDVLSGRIPRAPLWMQRIGMEWFFRLMKEPRRLGWRYFRSNTMFAWLLIITRFKTAISGAVKP